MKHRIAMWAAAGFAVAGGWALYFLATSRDHVIAPIVQAMINVTCPIAIVGMHYPISLYAALAANVATYALAGLVLETITTKSSAKHHS